MFILNKQVESLYVIHVEKYDEELFITLFDIANKTEIGEICIILNGLLSIEDKKNICARLYKTITNLETQISISNEVSCFI